MYMPISTRGVYMLISTRDVMNCRKGDLAMVVHAEHDPALLGILCTCLEHVAELPTVQGVRDWWHVRFAGGPQRSRSGRLVQEGYLRDTQLRTIATNSVGTLDPDLLA